MVVSSVASMGIGFVWYSKALFGKEWMRLVGMSENADKSGMGMIFTKVFILTLVSAYVLSIFIHYAGAYSLMNGAKTGLWAWLGFILPTGFANHQFTKKPMKLFLIDTGHFLVAYMVMGAILGAWY